jgi:hypothetical protein
MDYLEYMARSRQALRRVDLGAPIRVPPKVSAAERPVAPERQWRDVNGRPPPISQLDPRQGVDQDKPRRKPRLAGLATHDDESERSAKDVLETRYQNGDAPPEKKSQRSRDDKPQQTRNREEDHVETETEGDKRKRKPRNRYHETEDELRRPKNRARDAETAREATVVKDFHPNTEPEIPVTKATGRQLTTEPDGAKKQSKHRNSAREASLDDILPETRSIRTPGVQRSKSRDLTDHGFPNPQGLGDESDSGEFTRAPVLNDASNAKFTRDPPSKKARDKFLPEQPDIEPPLRQPSKLSSRSGGQPFSRVPASLKPEALSYSQLSEKSSRQQKKPDSPVSSKRPKKQPTAQSAGNEHVDGGKCRACDPGKFGIGFEYDPANLLAVSEAVRAKRFNRRWNADQAKSGIPLERNRLGDDLPKLPEIGDRTAPKCCRS